MLTPPTELTFLCVARKRDDGMFVDLFPHPLLLRMCGDAPFYLVRVTLNSDGPYWGWWTPDPSSLSKEPIHFVYPAKMLVEVCFPYGTKVEENYDRGLVVRCDVMVVRRLTPAEERMGNDSQVPELVR